MNGDELKELRERNGLSRAELAQALGTTEDAVKRAESGSRPLGKRATARLSEWDGGGTTPPMTSKDGTVTLTGEAAQAVLEDELPRPPYNPADQQPDDEEETDEKPKPRRRRVVGLRALAGWQAEAQTFLAGLIKGNAIPVEGRPEPIIIPGLAHGVQALWCPTCAVILANASDAWAAAFVKSYPNLARKLLVPGPQAELVIVTVTQIAIPCAVHHLHQTQHAAVNAEQNGAPPGE